MYSKETEVPSDLLTMTTPKPGFKLAHRFRLTYWTWVSSRVGNAHELELDTQTGLQGVAGGGGSDVEQSHYQSHTCLNQSTNGARPRTPK